MIKQEIKSNGSSFTKTKKPKNHIEKDLCLLGLKHCHEKLLAEFGEKSPSLITLKRWAAVDKIDKAKVNSNDKCQKYNYTLLADIVNEKIKDKKTISRIIDVEQLMVNLVDSNVLKNTIKTGREELDVSVIVEEIIRTMEPIINSAINKTNVELNKSLDNIETVRKNLMFKYDEEVTLLKQRNVELMNEIKTLKASTVDNTKISIQLSRILDAVQRIGLVP